MQKVLGWTTEIVCHPPKLAPDEVMRRWVTEWAQEGMSIDPEKLSRPRLVAPKKKRMRSGQGSCGTPALFATHK